VRHLLPLPPSRVARVVDTPNAASSTRRLLIVENPIAGRRATHPAVAQLEQRLRAHGWSADVARTAFRGHAAELAAQAARQGYDLVVAAGGDGTINEAIQGLVGTATALAALPIGTVNVWAAETGLPTHPERLASLIDQGAIRGIDVGRAGARYFLLMAGIGLDADVVRRVGPRLKRSLGRWAYAVSTLEIMRRYAGTPMTLRLDGIPLDTTALMVVIGNTRRYAGSFRLTPHALVDDGRLDVCIVPGTRLLRSPVQIGAALTGAPFLRRALVCRRATRIEIEADRPLPFQLDGDIAGFTPLTVEVVPAALRVLVPPPRPSGMFTPGAIDRA
jgi:YegS/Rv2252/BmrU family lipid kinase